MRFCTTYFAVTLLVTIAWMALACAAAENRTLQTAVEAFEEKEYDKSRRLLEEIIENDEKNPEVFYYLGRLDLIDGNQESAKKFLERAIDIDPGISEYHLWLATAIMQRMPYSNFIGRMSNGMRMLREFNRAIELDSKNIMARMTVFQVMTRSFERGGGSRENLMGQARSIAEIDSVMGCVAYGTYYQIVENDMSRAGELFEKGYRLDPGNRPAAISYADYLWLAGEKDQAIRILDSYVHENPEDKSAHFAAAAKIVLRGNDYAPAGKLYERSLLLKSETGMPNEAMVRWCLGLVHHLLGDKDAAEAEWSKVYQLDSDFDSVLETSPQLSELKAVLEK